MSSDDTSASLGIFQLRPPHCGGKTNHPYHALSKILTHRTLEHNKWLFYTIEFGGSLLHDPSDWNTVWWCPSHISLGAKFSCHQALFTEGKRENWKSTLPPHFLCSLTLPHFFRFPQLYWGRIGVIEFFKVFCCCYAVTKSCPTLCNPTDYSRPSSSVSTISQSLLKFMSVALVMPSNHLILCHSFLLLPSIFPSIRVFSMSLLCASCGQSTGASVSESVLPMNIQGWFPLGLTGLISMQSKGLSRIFSGTIQKH